MNASPRFAIYYAPESLHPLWAAGCHWLGRDPSRPEWRAPPHEATDAPRRYGFHATLKPPMALRAGASRDDFVAAVQALAARWSPFEMPALEVGVLHDFVALRPVGPLGDSSPLHRLAEACVSELDTWRAPGTKQPPRLPDDWQFHMTLSDPLPEGPARERMMTEARGHFAAALAQPLSCESLCVFTEPAEGQPFVLSHRLGFAR
jgi:hypothetical protein